ncbi:hypothetical protein F3K20_20235 [Streptomyces scabiei]|uniref:hypothetical protein n=1 Tax=Streptomyces scabiei TaxID=1930 RepID=UPI001B309642|nr:MULTISPECIES: hypothetical protein [Streptomyces]MDX3121571.1 hypothetical protein [Streptomyces scabiei]MDX3520375.1 hypothetical protein [Streptomyces scabiei]QTU46860.1 hypothetical protein F3K20_20235 [Streptomyces sp. LBUM 1482]
MTNTDKPTLPPRPTQYVMDEEQAGVLALLSQRYTDDLPVIRARYQETSVPVLLHAVHAHQARRLIESNPRWQKTTGRVVELEDRAEDVAAALALLQVARADLEGLESALLLAARSTSTHTGKPLLTFKKIAAALGVESEQAAQGRYRRKVGNLNGTDSGVDGTP